MDDDLQLFCNIKELLLHHVVKKGTEEGDKFDRWVSMKSKT